MTSRALDKAHWGQAVDTLMASIRPATDDWQGATRQQQQQKPTEYGRQSTHCQYLSRHWPITNRQDLLGFIIQQSTKNRPIILLFSYSAIQPEMCNETHRCQWYRVIVITITRRLYWWRFKTVITCQCYNVLKSAAMYELIFTLAEFTVPQLHSL